MTEFHVRTSKRIEALNITSQVVNAARGKAGKILHVYTPHTTCAITINEYADPDVVRDIIEALDRMVPAGYPYRHGEGNSDAHIKAVLVGASVSIPLSGDVPALGTWQGIFLMEFDGPRERKVQITVT
ncbi:MAG TPA: secondary thiamine-phosphate synthase enzyme YjbQ [Syntrophorhabdaceae bacterium]|nr:secondary thiamine-phosphate synthase enzyme YjbQ [Syntrophorhabdaceae bacterium]HOD76616.1 secondary thiamine-phosphate synthase enzyme YjbQ [Syntrophorhabdaceae bacterium]